MPSVSSWAFSDLHFSYANSRTGSAHARTVTNSSRYFIKFSFPTTTILQTVRGSSGRVFHCFGASLLPLLPARFFSHTCFPANFSSFVRTAATDACATTHTNALANHAPALLHQTAHFHIRFFFVAAVEHRTRFYRFRKVERRDISLTHTHWLKYARTNARIRPAGPFCLHESNKSLCTGEKIAAALHSTCTAAFSTRMSRTRIESASTSKLQANRPTSNTTQNSGGGETVRSKHRVHRLSVRLR